MHGATLEEHNTRLQNLLTKISGCGLKLNKEKCRFNQNEIEFLGNTINASGISVSQSKVDAIKDMKAPTNVVELRRVLGMINFLTKFVPKAQEILKSQSNGSHLTKKSL